MGVIIRQGVKNSAVNYLGVIIGALSTLFIYPLDWDVYGSLQYWIANATLLIPLLGWGSTALPNKFFPFFKKERIEGFFPLVLSIAAITILGMSVLLFVFRFIVNQYHESSFAFLLSDRFEIIYWIGVLLILSTLLQQMSYNYKRIVVPDTLSLFGIKVTLPLIVLLSYFQIISSSDIAFYLLLHYVVSVFLLFVYVRHIGAISLKGSPLKIFKGNLKKEMIRYWVFGGLNHIGAIVAYRIDLIMIGTIISKTTTGYYSFFLFLASVLEIPFRSINKISRPVISAASENNDISLIQDVYQKATKNLLIVGVLTFGIIWLNMDNLFLIMRNGEDIKQFKIIFFLLGLAKLLDMLTSINGLILIFSKWYQRNLWFLLLLGIINISLNFLFIGEYGIIGVAYASAISVLLFNALKSLFIYQKLKIHPFGKGLLSIFFLYILILCLEPWLHFGLNPWFESIMISIIFGLLYLSIIYYLKLSVDLNKTIIKVLLTMKSMFSR